MLQGVVAEDKGMYKCHARNKFGEIEAHGELIVRGEHIHIRGKLKASFLAHPSKKLT